jgi:hypothetical protein
MVSELLYWCSYGKCYIREQKDARPRVDAVTATTSNISAPSVYRSHENPASSIASSAKMKGSGKLTVSCQCETQACSVVNRP